MSSCAYHPERDVVGACVDCGKLVCAECKTTLGGKIYCNPCLEKAYSGVTKNTSGQGKVAEIPEKVRGKNRAKTTLGLLVGVLVVSASIVIIANWEDESIPASAPAPAPAPLVPLDRVQISPEAVTLTPGGVQQFSAKAFDRNSNDIKDITFRWTVTEGGGTVYENGIFVAGTEAGNYNDTVQVEATYDGASKAVAASITVTDLPSGQTLIFTPTMPAYVPGLGYLTYKEDFSNSLGWLEMSQDGREYYLKDEAYHMIVPSGYYSVWAPGKSLAQLGDFSLEVTLSRISGPGDSKYGITFKIGDTGQRGFILISHDGQAYFWKDEGQGTYVNSIEVSEGPITSSYGESLDKVKLGVERQGAEWKVSVNDSPVISVSDTAEPITGLGFEVSKGIHATFDNLKVYAVAPRTPPSAPSGFVVFSDTFEDGWNRGWSLNDNVYFQEGVLNQITANEQSYSSSSNERIPKISSFAYQAELYFKEAQSQTQGGLGLIKDDGNIYFAIAPITRQFEIYYHSSGERYNWLIGKTFSGAIKGPGEVNKLLVIGRDSSLEFYINDVFQGSFADPYSDSPLTKIRLYVDGDDSHVAFDNVVLHSLSPLPVSQVTFPTAISGDPPFSSDFSSPAQERIGPFATQIGDYFVSYTMTDAELSNYLADKSSASIRKKILDAVEDNFKDRIDIVIVILDNDEPPNGLYGINYSVQSGSVHNPTTPRFARLGNFWLTTRDGLDMGPALHELLHGFHQSMAQDSTTNFIIPTGVASHWGFSSAGGQLGGWDRNTLEFLGNGTYQATGPPKSSGNYPTNFGTIANGGNSIPYSNLELWIMGLIPDSELVSVDVAENASFIEAGEGKFTATAIRTYSPSEIIARTTSDNRPSKATPRAFRGLVVFATTRTTIDLATITQLNTDIEEFSMRSALPWGYNFWTATGMRASIHLATASELAR